MHFVQILVYANIQFPIDAVDQLKIVVSVDRITPVEPTFVNVIDTGDYTKVQYLNNVIIVHVSTSALVTLVSTL